MLTSKDIYNFLVMSGMPDAGATSDAPTMAPDAVPPLPMLTVDDGVEALRARLRALVGAVVKQSSLEEDVQRVFGDIPGELDPDAEPIDPEWEDVLRMVIEEEDDSEDPVSTTVQTRRLIS